MSIELKDSALLEFGKIVALQPAKNGTLPFKDHAQFPLLIDILGRKNQHHVVLQTPFSSLLSHYFLEAFLGHLQLEHTPEHFQVKEFIKFHLTHLSFTKAKQKTIEKDCATLLDALEQSSHYLIFALDYAEWQACTQNDDGFIKKQLALLLEHPKCRFIVFDHTHTEHQLEHFSHLPIADLSENDRMVVLKQQRLELENYHHVIIPEELLTFAYALAERYLSTANPLDKALELLDSCAARAHTTERVENNTQFKPVLTFNLLTQVLAAWVHIPASNLLQTKFKPAELSQGLQQRVFGQDAAIATLGHGLTHAQGILHTRQGPYCSFLFAGSSHTGKHTAALALAEQLFKQTNMFYVSRATKAANDSLLNLKFEAQSINHYASLKNIIQSVPYAILMIENPELLSAAMLDDLQEILTSGRLRSETGDLYSFRQAIIILSTQLGGQRLAELTKPAHHEEDETHGVDLIHLVLNDKKQEGFSAHDYSPQELAEDIAPEISRKLPLAIIEHTHIVPFIPLNRAAIEKIMRLNLKTLGKSLDTKYGIELGYAPEVVRFLSQEASRSQSNTWLSVDVNRGLNHLSFAIEQAILGQIENKNRPNQLFLQLNETGQSLRCEWLTSTMGRQHAQ